MISLATVIMKWSSRGTPFTCPPSPMIQLRRTRSFMSRQRLKMILRVSMSKALPCWMWLSIIAQRRLFALVIAWKSPVKWRLMSSIGTTWEYPPPAAPPLTPKTGPKDGSRRAIIAFFPIFGIAWPRPTVVVVFPSPAGVGLMAVTKMSFPSSFLARRFSRASESFAL